MADPNNTTDSRPLTCKLFAMVMIVALLLIGCGGDAQSSQGGTSEFGTSSEPAIETFQGSALEEIVRAIASGLWTGLTVVVCAIAKWWSPLAAFVVVFLLGLKSSGRYWASRYSLSTALTYGAAAGAAALLVTLLCWIF